MVAFGVELCLLDIHVYWLLSCHFLIWFSDDSNQEIQKNDDCEEATAEPCEPNQKDLNISSPFAFLLIQAFVRWYSDLSKSYSISLQQEMPIEVKTRPLHIFDIFIDVYKKDGKANRKKDDGECKRKHEWLQVLDREEYHLN